MRQSIFGIVFFLLCGLISTNAKAQLYEAGIHVGYNLSRLTVKEEQLSEQIKLTSGPAVSGASFGIQFMTGPPKDQNVAFFKIVPAGLFEASLCRCGGKINLISTNPDNSKSFSELEYLFYRGDYSVKFVANMKKLQFLIGPTFTNFFYTGVSVAQEDFLRTADDQFANFIIGYEFGVGVKLGTIMLSTRYQSNISKFGSETDLFPTEYGNYQLKFMLAYFFLSKHKDANWNSIYWK